MYGKILLCFFFAQESFGVQFLPAGSIRQWEGGVVSALYVLKIRVQCYLHFLFWERSGNCFTNVCTCAHLRMCLLHCIYESLFALTC